VEFGGYRELTGISSVFRSETGNPGLKALKVMEISAPNQRVRLAHCHFPVIAGNRDTKAQNRDVDA
jgi:hypothetical protein